MVPSPPPASQPSILLGLWLWLHSEQVQPLPTGDRQIIPEAFPCPLWLRDQEGGRLAGPLTGGYASLGAAVGLGAWAVTLWSGGGWGLRVAAILLALGLVLAYRRFKPKKKTTGLTKSSSATPGGGHARAPSNESVGDLGPHPDVEPDSGNVSGTLSTLAPQRDSKRTSG